MTADQSRRGQDRATGATDEQIEAAMDRFGVVRGGSESDQANWRQFRAIGEGTSRSILMSMDVAAECLVPPGQVIVDAGLVAEHEHLGLLVDRMLELEASADGDDPGWEDEWEPLIDALRAARTGGGGS